MVNSPKAVSRQPKKGKYGDGPVIVNDAENVYIIPQMQNPML